MQETKNRKVAKVVTIGILGDPELEKKDVKVICSEVIYQLIEQYQEWKASKLRDLQQKELEGLMQPCKLTVIPGYVFRESNPAIFGVEVTNGKLKTEKKKRQFNKWIKEYDLLDFRDAKSCGKCGTCVERLEAFEQCKVKDPLGYL